MPSKDTKKMFILNKTKKKIKIEFAKMVPLSTYQIGKDIKNNSICCIGDHMANLLLWCFAGGDVNVYGPPREN